MDNQGRSGPVVDNRRGPGARWVMVVAMELTAFHGPPRSAPQIPGLVARTLLGFGAHGEVWLADDLDTGDQVAVKVGRGAAAGGIERETALLCRIDHPHVVRMRRVVPFGDGELALVLDHAAGGSLASLVAARGRFEPGEVSTLLIPLAGALEHLHRRGQHAGGGADRRPGRDRPVQGGRLRRRLPGRSGRGRSRAGRRAFRDDLALVQRLRRRGVRLQGVRYRVSDVHVLRRRDDAVELRAVITTSAHAQVSTAPSVSVPVPADGPRSVVFTVVRQGPAGAGAARWRVHQVRAA